MTHSLLLQFLLKKMKKKAMGKSELRKLIR